MKQTLPMKPEPDRTSWTFSKPQWLRSKLKMLRNCRRSAAMSPFVDLVWKLAPLKRLGHGKQHQQFDPSLHTASAGLKVNMIMRKWIEHIIYKYVLYDDYMTRLIYRILYILVIIWEISGSVSILTPFDRLQQFVPSFASSGQSMAIVFCQKQPQTSPSTVPNLQIQSLCMEVFTQQIQIWKKLRPSEFQILPKHVFSVKFTGSCNTGHSKTMSKIPWSFLYFLSLLNFVKCH